MSFLLIECWLQGGTPLLCNKATEESLSGKTRSNTPGEQDDPRVICERGVYRLPGKQQLAIPGAAVARMLREAGGSHKVKGSRKSLKYLVPASVLVLDDLLPLFLNDRKSLITDFEVDSRPVTIPATKGRVMRHRARCNEWSCFIRLRLNDSIVDEATMRRLMIEGSSQIGLGDFRPEKGGPFGVSDCVHWIIVQERKENAARERNSRVRAA